MAPGFQYNFRQRDCPEKLGGENVEMAGEEWRKVLVTKTRSLWRRVFKTIFVNEILLKNLGLKTWKWPEKSCIERGRAQKRGACGTGFQDNFR